MVVVGNVSRKLRMKRRIDVKHRSQRITVCGVSFPFKHMSFLVVTTGCVIVMVTPAEFCCDQTYMMKPERLTAIVTMKISSVPQNVQ